MGVCKDQSVKHLAKFGYNVIMHPREGVAPLMLIGERNGARDLIGTLDQIVTGATSLLPKIVAGADAASISGKKTDKLDLTLGIDILGAVIGALGGNKIGVTAGFNHVGTLEFTYAGVTSDGINVTAVGDYLASGTPRFDHPILTQYLEDPGNLYVITEVVHSNKLGVTAYAKNGVGVSVDVPVISNAVGGKVKVSSEAENAGKVNFEGDKRLAFGFKAFEISTVKVAGARQLRVAPIKLGAIVFRAAPYSPRGAAPVMFPSLVIDLKEKQVGK